MRGTPAYQVLPALGTSQFRAAGIHLELPASDIVLEFPDTPAETQEGGKETKNRANYGSNDHSDVTDETVNQSRCCRSSKGIRKGI